VFPSLDFGFSAENFHQPRYQQSRILACLASWRVPFDLLLIRLSGAITRRSRAERRLFL